MHGRIKVKTTAEQDEERRKEQERKLKLFQKASSIAFYKIGNKEYDDAGLKVTAELLYKNSDISSLWNYRKRAILAMKDEFAENHQKLCENELELLVACLRNNPKSYGCWHHRCFIMLTMPTPTWEDELKLCNQFLQFDDRNFHCWDYRRFVVKHSVPEVPIDEELRVTNHLIENNFSNYSSWHYRSKLLPKRFPSLKYSEQIEEGKLLEELEYVQNAFFTDPNDQSAWFYHQWLVGRREENQKLISAHFNRESNTVTCVFRKPSSRNSVESNCSISVGSTIAKGIWKPVFDGFVKYCHAWLFKLSDDVPIEDFSIRLDCFDVEVGLDVGSQFMFSNASFSTNDEFRQTLGETKSALLKTELDSCIELNELEPGNKWIVLTLVQLMNIIDPDKYREDINKYVSELKSIDSSRRNYFGDLRSKIVIEQNISAGKLENGNVNLSDFGITRMYHVQYFSCVRILDLSKNSLTSLCGPLYLLQCCERFWADDNEIDDVTGICDMPSLSLLSLKGNRLVDVGRLKTIASCHVLKTLDIRQNPFECSEADVKRLMPDVKVSV